jgi:hypothetical protein
MWKLVICLLFASNVYAQDILECNYTDSFVVCHDVNADMVQKAYPAMVISYLIIEISKSLTVEMIKELVVAEYKKRHKNKPVPAKVVLLRAHHD